LTKREKSTTKAHTMGGREGACRTDDGRLEVKLSSPGTSGTGTNPEQLFAAGWSACFLSAIKLAAGKRKVALPAELAIDAEVDLGTTRGAYGLAARFNVSLPGLEREVAQALVDAAHQLCPYSAAGEGLVMSSQVLNLARERRLSHAKSLCGAPVMLLFSNGYKISQMSQFHSDTLMI
jgi:lipoyl-dependent peroxiredoxin